MVLHWEPYSQSFFKIRDFRFGLLWYIFLFNRLCYPKYRNVDIILFVRVWITFEIQLSYSVIDPNTIVSSIPPKKTILQPLWMIYFPRKYATIDRYFLQVEKYRHIWLTQYFFNETSMNIYDGPGYLSPLLLGIRKTRNQTIYMTSTFQCIVQSFWRSQHQNITNSHNELRFQPVDLRI